MSYRPRGGGTPRGRGGRRGGGGPRGAPPFDLWNDFERQRYVICQEVGLIYPPDIGEVCRLLQVFKHEGEMALHECELHAALSLYTSALKVIQLFPSVQQVTTEYHKVLCNRSLVFLRMNMFKDAEDDAMEAIASSPSFIKGYWRASQAVKGGHSGIQRALPYIIEGLRRAQNGEGTTNDVITFLTELCIMVPKAPLTNAMDDVLKDLVPTNEEDVWLKVLEKLSRGNHWESISMLMIAKHSGPISKLDRFWDYSWNCSCISLGTLLSTIGTDKLRDWGENLVIYLINSEASIDEIGHKHGKPSVHVGVNVALKTGTLYILEAILDKYGKNSQKKNAQDTEGRTAVHVLVMSGVASTIHGMAILKSLLDHHCDANIKDSFNKRPIDYLPHYEAAYVELLKRGKTVEELRAELEVLKSRGNEAKNSGNLQEALKLYSEAVELSQQSKNLYKEAAMLYSNRANVLFSLGNYNEALTNALAATNCDSSWHKGYWWKAKILLNMGSVHDAFSAYMDGYVKSTSTADVKFSFLLEATILLAQIQYTQDGNFMSCYNQLRFLDKAVWPLVLTRLSDSRTWEWKSIAYLILGPNLKKERFGRKVTEETIGNLCSGVAGTTNTDDVQANTVFQYLKKHGAMSCSYWLDATLFAVYCHGSIQSLMSLSEFDYDTPLHAAVRFALMTGRTSLIEQFPIQEHSQIIGENRCGDSVFHTITKLQPLPDANILGKVTEFLLNKGLSVMKPDRNDRLPVDYLDSSYPGYIFDIFFKASKVYSLDDINRLKEEGNKKFKAGEVEQAIELYTKAIDAFKSSNSKAAHEFLTNHEIAVLYGNRAEGYLKLKQFHEACNDAYQCVSFDGHWYKAHIRVGKSLRGLSKMADAMKAFINGYKDVDANDGDTVKVEILVELTMVCTKIPRGQVDVRKKLPNFPKGQGHIWAKASYELICKNEWNTATVAFFQFSVGSPIKPHITCTLKPMCNLRMLKGYGWGLELMQYFLDCGSDKKTISIDTGDTCLHAAVRMTMVVEKNVGLLEYLLRHFCKETSERNLRDSVGNTALHVATQDPVAGHVIKISVVIVLLKYDVDPVLKNNEGRAAHEYLRQDEIEILEVMRMAMYDKVTFTRLKKAPCFLQTPPPAHPYKDFRSKSTSKNNQSQKPKAKVSRSCDTCDDLYSQGQIRYAENDLQEGHEKMVEIFQQKHKSARHDARLKDAIGAIVKKLGETHSPDIPKCLTSIPAGFFLQMTTALANNNKWRQLDSIVRKYRTMHGSDKLKGFASSLTVVPVIRDETLKAAEDLKLQIICNLLNSQATIGSDNGQMALKSAINEDHFKVVAELIRRGADTSVLSLNDRDTPIHAALAIVLEKEKVPSLLEFLLDQFDQDSTTFAHLDPEQTDCNGDCLFHIIAKAKYSTNVLKVTEILCKRKLSAHVFNNDRKLPIHYITRKNDRRLQFIRLAATVEVSRQPSHGSSSPRKEGKTGSSDDDLHQYRRSEEIDSHPNVTEVVKIVPMKETRKRKVEELIRILPDSKISFFNVDDSPNKTFAPLDEDETETATQKEGVADKGISVENTASVNEKKSEIDMKTRKLKKDDINTEKLKVIELESADKDMQQETDFQVEVEGVAADGNLINTENEKKEENNEEELQNIEIVEVDEQSESDDDEETEEEEYIIDVQVFDNLEWEVECTAEVWKTLRDKHVLPDLKQRIVHKIQLLACGEWQPHLCKKLKNVPPSLNLFEAKFSKGSRIIWELAVAFSPRCSETAERRLQVESGDVNQPVRGGRIYSEIIRVWEIVLDHDKIHRCVEKIKKSHDRGGTCIIQKKLRGIKSDGVQIPLGAAKRYPMLYAEEDVTLDQVQEHKQDMQRFFPPASANDTEYHILKFYSFSSALVSHVLQNIETKVDFPFRVTDLEHAIINLRSNAPILLLGRSGTGKTTCCLYRLWSQFHSYWTKAKEADAPLLPRCVEFVHQENDQIDSEEELSDETDTDSEEENEDGACGSSYPFPSDSATTTEEPAGDQYDHVHQLFITKNAVLCSEVQKNFRELSHADDLMEDHVQHEEDNVPSRFQDVDDYTFPLFLTSRQLLLMLDASIGPPYFFQRKEDGSLKVDIAGWSDTDGPLSFLPLLDEDSDMEDDGETFVEEEDDMDGDGRRAVAGKKMKVDPRREITYTVFVEEIWPKIKKKVQVSYHPSLIWTEIMSFIKGSYEALSKQCGYLQKDEYIKLGKKRAPNFSGERDVIYNFFVRYEHFKRQNSLFDETDLVHDGFRRLREMESRPWVIHQVYVDETQDFTQAELCLLIRLCQNPNEMFLTGDTAQSIMRGISFRFSDLRSLFYHAKQSMQAMGKTSAVEVPKQVYQLTHNYRSHAGILSLASSILELMVEFFPESFDRLQRDQGLFNGPQPILLESCSFGDLAVLLRGNRRKTSHIEFGAHQAILVVSDAARDAIPEELRLGLVLTIYEAKGLEFDDVLLYNFFKDSQALKEWRVVTEYLERLASTETSKASQNTDSLIEIDEGVLRQENRPRPLIFDSNQHKVLNSELKHLYTALTRARVNVWIFDEDMEKRAPMFEYFKARKLVKSLTVSEINEESLSETIFAEKSSSADWIRRGDDFMRHSLYGVAAKCFGMGEDQVKEKIALAHGQALVASRLKDNPRQMREEFLYAAELYLECNRPAKAAICLQNARERELAAGLFEKLGQNERAAEIYRRMKHPQASSRCYEQLGNFNKAVEVLYENGSYDMAIDTLRRYEMLLQDLHREARPIPEQLIVNKPKDVYTVEKLSHRAAEFYHKYKNEEKMLDALDRFNNFNDRVDFLKNKGYILHAARLLENENKLKQASDLLLMYGRMDEATAAARKTLDEPTIAYCQLVTCRVIMSKRNKIELQEQHLLDLMKEAKEMFQSCQNNDGFGEVNLLQAELSCKIDNVKLAWKAFKGSKPFANDAGLVECADWLFRYSTLDSLEVLKPVIESIGYMFNICQALLYSSTPSNVEKVRKFDQFYGLVPSSHETLAVHPKEKPLCMRIIADMFQDKARKKKPLVELGKIDVHQSIVENLLKRTNTWLEPIWNALIKIRNQSRVCDYYQVGLECPNYGSVDNPCTMMHKPETKESFQKLINLDIQLIEYESNVQSGASLLKKNCPTNIEDVIHDYLAEGERDISFKYEACKYLWDDLMPAKGHPMVIGEQNKELLRYLQSNGKVHAHLKKFLVDKWNDAVSKPDSSKRLKCKAVRETEIFLLLEFGFHLFGFEYGRRKMEPSPKKEMTKLETTLEKEIRSKHGYDFKKIEKYYTLMMGYARDNNCIVECVARRFTDAYSLISKGFSDPYEAVFKFNKFMLQLSLRREVSFLPEMKHYLFWIEFFTTLNIFLIAKLKAQAFPEFAFILPSSYLALVRFVEASFPNEGYPVRDSVDYWKPNYKQLSALDKLTERLKYMALAISGHSRGIHLLNHALVLSLGDPVSYAIVERLLILSLVLVCNVGKAVPVESEVSLLKTMSHIDLPNEAPGRLHKTIESVKSAKGIADIATILKDLLSKRQSEENLLVCKWRIGRKHQIESEELQNVMLFANNFLNKSSMAAMQNVAHAMEVPNTDEQLIESGLTEEEIQKSQKDKEAQMMEAKRNSAALTITEFFRSIKKAREGSAGAKVEERSRAEFEKLFGDVCVDDNMCGFCGLNFEQKLKDQLEYEGSTVIGGTSVLNEELYQPLSPKSSTSPIWPSPTSPEQDVQGPSYPWGRSTDGSVMDNSDTKVKILQTIKNKHLQDGAHIQKEQEFQRFKNRYQKDLAPKLKTMKQFLYNSSYGLDDRDYREKNYEYQRVEINRMFTKYSLVEKEIQMLMSSRAWSMDGRIDQNMKELVTDFKRVEPYVVEVQDRLKQEKEDRLRQASASVSVVLQQSESWEDDLEEIEPVVQEPVKHSKSRIFRCKGRGNKRF